MYFLLFIYFLSLFPNKYFFLFLNAKVRGVFFLGFDFILGEKCAYIDL